MTMTAAVAVPAKEPTPSVNDRIKDVESMQETVRNKRQMASTAFQNFDQKSNQLYNMMSAVMKAFNEMRSGRAYVVDSWFEDNGGPAHIRPLEEWRAGWKPPGFVDSLL